MAERERVKQAIEASVDGATKLLAETPKEDVETRLAMLIDGWGRGLAAGLEELAVAIGELRRPSPPDEPSAPRPSPPPVAEAKGDADDATRDGRDPRSEDELRAEAARSRDATAELRDELRDQSEAS